MKPIRSMEEFERLHYPEDVERKRLAAMTPEQWAVYLAQRALDKVFGKKRRK